MIEERISELLEEYYKYFSNDNSWLKLKKFLLRSINVEGRKKFSTRHHSSKKHFINDYEEAIIKFYYKNFGVELILKESEKHTAKYKKVWEK